MWETKHSVMKEKLQFATKRLEGFLRKLIEVYTAPSLSPLPYLLSNEGCQETLDTADEFNMPHSIAATRVDGETDNDTFFLAENSNVIS